MQLIDKKRPSVLRMASATISVNKMVKVSGERIRLDLPGRQIETVYYKAASDNAPLLIGFHSGGWLMGGCALNDSMWHSISEEMDINIASIGYRKAPAYKWRDSLDDAYDASFYLIDHADEFGFDAEQVSIIGPSAGGNLCAAVCIKALKNALMPFKHQILLYPLLDLATEPALKGSEHFGGAAAFIMNEQHVSPDESRLSLVSPFFASDEELKGFPPTLTFVCENDVLKHEGKAFSDHLASVGVDARCIELDNMSHCFYELGYRDKLTPFEVDFIGEKGVSAFESGLTHEVTQNINKIIKEELNR